MPEAVAVTKDQVETSRKWIRDFYAAFDGFERDPWFAKYYKPDTVINLCNNPPMQGWDNIRAHFDKEQACLTSMKHDLKHIDVLSDRILVQNQITFVVKADPKQEEVKINACACFWKNVDEDKLTSVDVYFDPAPLIQKIVACH